MSIQNPPGAPKSPITFPRIIIGIGALALVALACLIYFVATR